MFADEILDLCETTKVFLSRNQLHCQMFWDFMEF